MAIVVPRFRCGRSHGRRETILCWKGEADWLMRDVAVSRSGAPHTHEALSSHPCSTRALLESPLFAHIAAASEEAAKAEPRAAMAAAPAGPESAVAPSVLAPAGPELGSGDGRVAASASAASTAAGRPSGAASGLVAGPPAGPLTTDAAGGSAAPPQPPAVDDAAGAAAVDATRMQPALSVPEAARLKVLCASPAVRAHVLRQMREGCEKAGLAGFEMVHAGGRADCGGGGGEHESSVQPRSQAQRGWQGLRWSARMAGRWTTMGGRGGGEEVIRVRPRT